MGSISIIKFKEFQTLVAGNITQCGCKDLNEVLNKFFANDYDFTDHEDTKTDCVS